MAKIKVYNKKSFYLGVILVAVGILFNRLSIEATIAPDKQIESTSYIALITIFQIIAIIAGISLIIKQPSIRAPNKTELVLLISSLFLTVFLLEIGAKVWLKYLAPPDQYKRYTLFTDIASKNSAWSPHHYLNYYPTPNYRNGLTFHNSLGYRNSEFSLEKPNDVYRIVALGGSTTYTVRVDDNNKAFTAQLEKLLKDEHSHKSVEVINAGVPGYNSWESLINLQFRVLDIDPDLIIVYHGTNDVHARLVEPSFYRGDNSGRRQQWKTPTIAFWEYSTLLRILSRKTGFKRQVSLDDFVTAKWYRGWPFKNLDNDNLTEVLIKNSPIYFRRNLENMIAITKAHDIKIMFATWAHSPYFNDYTSTAYYKQGYKENNEVATEIASSHDILLFDFASVMPQDERYWADGRHVNEEGAAVKAELFAEFIHTHRLITQ